MSEPSEKSSVPLPVDFSLNTSLTCNVKCGDCVFFARHYSPAYKEPCIKLGISSKSKPCKRFSPDAAKLNIRNDVTLRKLSSALRNIGKDNLHIVASILLKEARTRREGFYFGQPVYVKVFGGDYLSNYRKAYVSHVERGLVHLSCGRNINDAKTFTASVSPEAVLTVDEWKTKKSRLLSKGMKRDPKLSQYTTLTGPKIEIDYEPPTIDTDFDAAKKRAKLKGKTTFASVAYNSDDSADKVFKVRGNQ
jgi:hypothetical protein